MHFPGKRPIRVGDSTTHGGTVLPSAHRLAIDGKQAAGLGDDVMCPLCGLTVITECDRSWRLGGTFVALHGHRTSCGASLISSLPG
ncbi:PAAR domain-containing protein [Paraburkholderia tropica]|uniref:PAAR domain-containing protein n=1 Tax=Paraburkholderia tropica TaxID=92647 RepID=UPI001CC36D8F